SLLLFFFSSRIRHTRSKRDWSSDVCSSDLSFLILYFFTNIEKTVSQLIILSSLFTLSLVDFGHNLYIFSRAFSLKIPILFNSSKSSSSSIKPHKSFLNQLPY